MKINKLLETNVMIQPKKIEVVVGALTENDVKDHGTATGVVKTVNKQKNKMRPHVIMRPVDEADQVRDSGLAEKLMGQIKKVVKQNPPELIGAQANQRPQGALKLLS